MHRSGTNLPWPADTHRPCSHSHPFNPSALSLAGSGNISPRLLFGACQQCSFVKQRPSCQVIQSACSPFPLGIRARFLPQQPQPLSARGSRAAGRTPGSLAGTQGHRDTTLHSPRAHPCSAAKGLGRRGSREFGTPGWGMAEITSEGDQNKHSHPMISYRVQRAPSHSRTKGAARGGLEL